MSFKDTIKALRYKAGLTQRQIADKLDISVTAYQNWEYGRSFPSPDKIKLLASVLGVDGSVIANFATQSAIQSDVTPVSLPDGRTISVPLLSPEVTACCGDGIPTYDEIQNEPEKAFRYTISELGGTYDEMRPPCAVRADGACLEKSRIFDGDILIFNPALEPRQGKVHIVCWDGALSAKKVVRHGDGSITLYSDADEFHLSPQEAGDPDRFSIWGPVVKSVVNFR